MSDPVRGLWLDESPRRTLTPGYLERIRDEGYRSISICTGEPGPWRPRWATSQLEAVAARAVELDLEVSLMLWPQPSFDWLYHALASVAVWARLPIVAFELDLEGLWRARYLLGYSSLDVAGRALVDELRRVTDGLDVRIDVTTFASHAEAGPAATVTPRCDRFCLQSYSTRHDWQGREVEWGSRLAPGVRQRADVAACPWRDRLCLGLALWDQDWPGHDAAESMQVAEDAARMIGPREIRWWSAKHRGADGPSGSPRASSSPSR